MRGLLTVTAVSMSLIGLTGCGTQHLAYYPAGLTYQQAMQQSYQCEREAQRAIPMDMDFDTSNDWQRMAAVARMRNRCLAAFGWANDPNDNKSEHAASTNPVSNVKTPTANH